ncbi:8042_t:CDS:1, partial [Racocetra fulgida]
MFGGLGGLETSIDADQDLKCTGEEADALFDLWINTCPGQGSRTIRTE